MAISRVFYNNSTGTSASLSGSGIASGDYIVVWAYRNTTTSPSVPSGYTSIASGSGNSNAYRIGFKVATGSETDTSAWTNATVVHVGVYRGVGSLGGHTNSTKAASATVTIPSFALTSTNGKSWVVEAAGTKQTTSQGNFANYTTDGTLPGTSCDTIFGDTNGGVSSYTGDTSASGASATYAYAAVELIAAETAPNAPTLTAPSNGATGVSTTPEFDFSATDPEGDPVSYELQVDTSNLFNSIPNSAVSYIQSSTPGTLNGVTGPVTSAYGTSVTAGNRLVVAVFGSGTTVGVPTDTIGTTYTLDFSTTAVAAAVLKVFSGIAPSSGANTVSATTDNSSYYTMHCFELSSNTIFDGASVPGGARSSNPISATAYTNIGANAVIFAMFDDGSTIPSATAWTDNTGTYSDIKFANNADFNGSMVMSKIVTSSASQSASVNETVSSGTPFANGCIVAYSSGANPILDALSLSGGHDAPAFSDITTPFTPSISHVQEIGAASDNSVATFTVTPTLATTVGNTLFVGVVWYLSTGTYPTCAVTDTQGNSYSSVYSFAGSASTGPSLQIFATTNALALTTSDHITATFTGTAPFAVMIADEWSGLSSVLDGSAVTASGGPGTSVSFGTLTTTNAVDAVMVYLASFGNLLATTWSSPWSSNTEFKTASPTLSLAWQDVTSTGSFSGTATLGASEVWDYALIAIQNSYPPYGSGDSMKFIVPGGEALTTGITYFWRVRAIDPTGTNTWGSWSSVNSFTVGGGSSSPLIPIRTLLQAITTSNVW